MDFLVQLPNFPLFTSRFPRRTDIGRSLDKPLWSNGPGDRKHTVPPRDGTETTRNKETLFPPISLKGKRDETSFYFRISGRNSCRKRNPSENPGFSVVNGPCWQNACANRPPWPASYSNPACKEDTARAADNDAFRHGNNTAPARPPFSGRTHNRPAGTSLSSPTDTPSLSAKRF